MSLHLTPAMLAGAYELLRTTPPIKRWKLPPAEGVEMRVTTTDDYYGLFEGDESRRRISISTKLIGSLDQLIRVMAHEMIHFAQFEVGFPVAHGEVFWRVAKQICKHHSWDVKSF